MNVLWTIAATVGLAILVAAWRPATLRDLITRTIAVIAAPAADLRVRLAAIADGLARGLRQLALHDESELTGWRIVGHYLGGLALTAVFVLGALAEWALVALTFAGFFDTHVELPEWMPSPETLSGASLVIAPSLFGAVMLDLLGVTHLSNWGDRDPRVRWWAGLVCVVGILLAVGLLGIGGWARGTAAWEAAQVPLQSEGVTSPDLAWMDTILSEGSGELESPPADSAAATLAGVVSAGTPVVLALSLVFAGTGIQAVGQLAAAIPAAAGWLVASMAMAVLGMWSVLMNMIAGALLSAVTWAASLFRPDPVSGRWWVPDQVGPPEATAQPGPRAAAQPPQPAARLDPEPEPDGPPAGPARGNGADPDPNFDTSWRPL